VAKSAFINELQPYS